MQTDAILQHLTECGCSTMSCYLFRQVMLSESNTN